MIKRCGVCRGYRTISTPEENLPCPRCSDLAERLARITDPLTIDGPRTWRAAWLNDIEGANRLALRQLEGA